MTSVRRLVLLRHGQTEYNAASRMQGHLDTDLTELGRTQAEVAARALALLQPHRIVSSDLRRAHDTATALSAATGVPVELDERLRETHLGDWQGLTHLDVDDVSPGVRESWRADAGFRPPGGESRVDVAERSMPLIQELLKDPEWTTAPVVVVAHGGTIAALTAALLDLPVDRWPVLGGLGNASWVQVAGHGTDDVSWRLDVWNATAAVAGDVL
ncbi:histidine phosphatase family protein [Rhodococcus sp. BP-349]|uniref:histidine phosphatase family protein n=1 Tax=unclassified Rhodococcus (in: high G+C Gram-positive bacteria) TaxID=192944 RepID=UPI001C9AF103|nr:MULTISPECIES: histidine phosphatase family protein [unclassified Rhodococcus (in: high G+C Gram-positive bacteria)]MBY6540562.1 histidine phosphatase family protein [Rhodococcus sp. BP-363]MBY6545413.1 histidine phosphatase family protein [Rhodococcus sp. BP-369]MBY6564643.1 histidine phosphatase family protein [Rhodococcus sp. BP-370]MBY6578421.1 histidine phosphatase family protein [Rhodococcus sp. BP-364]MBY6587722.1 histidine phosphatase family protein [Rhodococcus sp. BP-358]